MAEGSIGGPSGSANPPTRGVLSDLVAVVSWQAEVSSDLPPATEILAYERSIPNAGKGLLVLVERKVEPLAGKADRGSRQLQSQPGIDFLHPDGRWRECCQHYSDFSRKAGRRDCGHWSDRSTNRNSLSRQESQLIIVAAIYQLELAYTPSKTMP